VDGQDLRDLTLESLRRAVTIVFEDTFLFSTTIRENIAFGRPDATMDEIERAAVAAHAHGFICGLPDGYDTVVGERGFTLSGGQRQRIALARAALVNPRILVLDDATSAVDARTEAAIHRSFDEILAERTTVLIAHRASTLRLADRVILVDRGRIVATGTTDELLAESELLRELLAGPEVDPTVEVPADVDEVDPAAWPSDVSRVGALRMSGRASALVQSVGGGRGASVAAMTSHLAKLATESPELVAAAEQLPALHGDPDVDLDVITEPEEAFSFRKVLRPFVRPLAVGGALVLIDTLTTLAGPLLIRRGIDSGVLNDSTQALRTACLLFLAVQIVSFFNAIAMTFQTSRTAERLLFSLRVRTFAHLQRLSLDFYDRQMAGKIMTRMTSDVDAFAQLVQQGLLTALVSILSCVGIAVVLLAMAPSLTLAVAIVLPPLAVGTVWFRRVSARNYAMARERLAILYADMQESLSGVRVSQAFAQQPASEARFTRLADSHNEARHRSVEMIARFFPFIQLMSIVAKAIALAVGGEQVASGSLSSGVLIAFLLYLDQFFTPIQQLSNVFDQWLQANVAVTQLTELLRTPTGTPQAENTIRPGRLAGHLRFDNVQFAYPTTGLVALHTLDLEVPAGQVVALVGTTGAGKSTLVKLAARFYDPTAGAVYVDGMPLREIDLPAYRHQLGYVPQEPFLFSGTIRTNIAYGREAASDLEVERAARAVGAHEFIASLPLGYHTPVAEEGRSMSAGQRQLLGLARAHLVDPAILLLDEATANLDLATEARVQRAMGLVARGRSTLLIAHRLQTARAAQRIVVLDEGRVVEDGSHDELVESGGRYAELWAAFRQSQDAR
jgi:ATP-binding cassette subfamily B protein